MKQHDELENLLKEVESDRDERTNTDKFGEAICAFANDLPFDTLPCRESDISDLSRSIFKLGYLELAISPEALQANHREEKEQMASLKFFDLKAGCPTYAGILMFGKKPEFFLPGGYVQYVRFKGNDVASEFDYEYKFTGDLFTQMKVMEEFIKSQIAKKVQKKLGDPYYYQFPPDAIKELLYNAIIHRNYQSNAPIKFYEYADRIEINNPGGLYGQSAINFPVMNDYRNPALAEAAKTAGFVNRFSLGIRRAITELKNNGSKEPSFMKDDPGYFQVTIYMKEN